jgi:methyl-accepting chemotaxis protein
MMPANHLSPAESADAAGESFDTHLKLDEAIDATLDDLVANTEVSAIATMTKIRELYESATQVAGLFGGSDSQQGGLGADVLAIMTHLVEVGTFIEELPIRMKRDLANAQNVARQIRELSMLVEDVRSISTQSHMLGINTAIQAANAGTDGTPFKVIADEMRKLASAAKDVSTKIINGLSRARETVENEMAASITRSSDELDKVTDTSSSIAALKGKLEDMRQQHQTQLATIAGHNDKLAQDIAEALGHIQYQDILRQSIDRIRATIQRRNACIQDALQLTDSRGLEAVPQQLELILAQYLSAESQHTRAAQHLPETGELKIELF